VAPVRRPPGILQSHRSGSIVLFPIRRVPVRAKRPCGICLVARPRLGPEGRRGPRASLSFPGGASRAQGPRRRPAAAPLTPRSTGTQHTHPAAARPARRLHRLRLDVRRLARCPAAAPPGSMLGPKLRRREHRRGAGGHDATVTPGTSRVGAVTVQYGASDLGRVHWRCPAGTARPARMTDAQRHCECVLL
jgi:hypothetical protein